MKVGIIGLPNVGKSTLFNALTKAGAASENFPFTTIEPNTGFAPVADHRLDELARVFTPEKTTPVAIKVIDIAGLIKGAAEGEGLGNAFLSHIAEVDVIIEVVRGFADENIAHVSGRVDPEEDIRTIETELILKDIETRERALEVGREFKALTSKPILYVVNGPTIPESLKGKSAVAVNAKLEQELSLLADVEREELMRAYGIKESALGLITRKVYEMLGLITFFTSGVSEVRGWSIERGTKAPQAAGKVHSDMERGFIAADVIGWEELVEAGSWERSREQGKVRLEGRDYEIKDGDTVIFKFNV